MEPAVQKGIALIDSILASTPGMISGRGNAKEAVGGAASQLLIISFVLRSMKSD